MAGARRALRGLALGAAAAGVLWSATPAGADSPSMTFTLGRLAGSPACGAACADFIVANGEIGFGSAVAFLWARTRAGGRDIPVLLNSPGGYVVGATNLGRMWRKLGVTVIVADAKPRDCGKRDKACDPADEAAGVKVFSIRAHGAECASACPFALAGATARHLPAGARIGLHESYIDEKDDVARAVVSRMSDAERAQARRDSQAELEAFAREMGVDPDIAVRMMRTPHEDMEWISAADVARYRLSTGAMAPVLARIAAALAAAPAPRQMSARKSERGTFAKR